MSGQYLWDGSGEPDPEIEMLERKLAVFRHRPDELELPEREASRGSRYTLPRFGIWQIAVAASIAVLLCVGAILWISHRSRSERGPVQNTTLARGAGGDRAATNTNKDSKDNKAVQNQPATPSVTQVAQAGRKPSEPHRFERSGVGASGRQGRGPRPVLYSRASIASPFEVAAAEHLEKTQMLLRSFKNSNDTGAALSADIEFDRQQSRRLVYQNIVLRRSAGQRGNLPLQELLGSVEPFLLDIANLPDHASAQDVQTIRDRIRGGEIVADLQAFALPPRAAGF